MPLTLTSLHPRCPAVVQTPRLFSELHSKTDSLLSVFYTFQFFSTYFLKGYFFFRFNFYLLWQRDPWRSDFAWLTNLTPCNRSIPMLCSSYSELLPARHRNRYTLAFVLIASSPWRILPYLSCCLWPHGLLSTGPLRIRGSHQPTSLLTAAHLFPQHCVHTARLALCVKPSPLLSCQAWRVKAIIPFLAASLAPCAVLGQRSCSGNGC